MKRMHLRTVALCLLMGAPLLALADEKLSGKVIGTPTSVDYSTSRSSTTVNTCAMAFDGNLNTFFASWERSYTWAGLDLGSPYIITRVGWSPRNDSNGPARVQLGVFEGANSPDFADALPLHIIAAKGTIGQLSYADVACSKGFRYVRYVGPADARCNVAELEFYGHEGVGDSSQLYRPTNLPLVSIHTQNGVLPYDKEHEIATQLTLIGAEGDAPLLSEPGTIRERGNASRTFPKKPYRIKFDKKQRVLDAPAKAKKWTLINNYGDKTLMRNLLAFELSRRLGMPYTPYGRAVDVLVNGEYKGCYQLCDQVQVHKGRVDIDEMTPLDNSGTALTGGYLFEIDAYAYEEEEYFYSSRNNPVTIKSPSADSITSQQRNYIRTRFNTMEQQWSRYLDLNTFLRHFLVGELSGNTDTYWSVFMYKQRGNDTIFTGPVWDFDLAFENDNRTYPVNSKTDYIYRTVGSCAGNMRTFVNNIVVSNATARQRLLQIWDEARQAGLTEENLVACIDSLEASLQQSQQLNFVRWPIMNTRVHQNPRTWGSYAAEVQNVRRFMKERLAWMDKKLGYVYTPRVNGLSPVLARVDFDRPYQVYGLSGQLCGSSLNGLAPGIYVVRQGQAARKVTVQ
ncbi:MAG: CotH kinase family protein [Prevotella sp.]|nr:CotH kinase family protein [Prevotella sp.]